MAIAAALLAALTIGAGPAAIAPRAAPVSPDLSERLLLPTYTWSLGGSHLTIERGTGTLGPRVINDSLTADGLAEILSESPGAHDIARRAHRELSWGYSLAYSGALSALAGLVCITAGTAQITDSSAQVALGTAGGSLLLAGVVSGILGAVWIESGFSDVLKAVNVYNLDLVRGR